MPTRHPLLSQALALAEAGRVPEALPALADFARAGDRDALFALGRCFWSGEGVPQDLPRGRALLRAAAEAGHALAAIGYTNLLGNGVAGPRDWAEALRRLEGEARRDPARAAALSLLRSMRLTEDGNPAIAPAEERLSESPWASLFPGAFSAAECDYLIRLAEPNLRPSLVGDGAGREVRREHRTSDDTTIPWMMEDPATHALNRRLAAMSGTRPEQAEALIVLRYRGGQEYRPHVDWDGGENGRIVTALVYLNDDYDGGETLFVKTGLKVKGKKGDVLVFRSTTPEGSFDPLSEHAGLPVTRGVKFLATRWIHARDYKPGH